MTNTTVSSQNTVDELNELAARLNELGLHDEGISVAKKANALKRGKPILSKKTLQERVDNSPQLDELKYSLRATFPNGVYLHSVTADRSVSVVGILAKALVEVIALAGGTLETRESHVLTCRRLSIPLGWMNYADTFARAEDLILPLDGSKTLRLL